MDTQLKKRIIWSISLVLVMSGAAIMAISLQVGESYAGILSRKSETAISGTVFRDMNSNGILEAREPGEPNIDVSVYDAENQLIATAPTDINGNYVISIEESQENLALHGPFKVVFSGWADHLSPGPHGPDSRTEIQFASTGDKNVNFGLINPDQYVPADQPVVDIKAKEEKKAEMASSQEITESSTETGEWLFEGEFDAPKFPEGLDWLNTEHPLTLDDMRGKVVLLEFWTYGCIACVHEIPKLQMLAQAYPEELVIIAVHSAKYPQESDTEHIHKFLQRYQIEYPVINDKSYGVAKSYGANVWPSYAIITPTGKFLTGSAGSMRYDEWYQVIGDMIVEFEGRELMDREPLDLEPGLAAAPETLLRFPGAILADEDNQRLFIVDSYHNRILISDLSGQVLDVIGNGLADWQDGDYDNASFFYPQGITLADENTLYVADSENHLLRRVDLLTRTVETVAGVGERVYVAADEGPALESRLNSPWDVLFIDGLVYIAMAGQHQLWVYDPAAQTMARYAGSGIETLRDAPLHQAGLNQPTALASDGETIYFADSEGNAIRQADLDPTGEVETIVGMGFWSFGDQDGIGEDVFLQRPTGIAYYDGLLYVADTYNNKIKIIDPETRQARAFLGTGASAWRDGVDPIFDEPAGLSVTSDKLYIADSNNHAIRVVDLATVKTSTLVLRDPEGLLAKRPGSEAFSGNRVTLEPQSVAPGEGSLLLDVSLPEGYKINSQAPAHIQWQSEDESVIILESETGQQTIVESAFPLAFKASFIEGSTTLTGKATLYYCESRAESLCLLEEVQFIIPVKVTSTSQLNTLIIEYAIDPQQY